MPDTDETPQPTLPAVIATVLPNGSIHIGTNGDVSVNDLFVIAAYLTNIANKELNNTKPDKRPTLLFGHNGSARRGD